MTGQTISHYRVLEKLGEGGMGEVYRAEDTSLGRAVALKFLASHLLNDDEAKQRFLREAKAAAAITHPNICTVHEVGEEGGKTFLAMAYLEGESLEDKIARGPLPLKEALDIGRQIAEGLEAAHEKGIVHRDIKPANIMVDGKGRATILDFGLARLTEASKLTRQEQTVGTAAYMSPEQIQGGKIDHRTDIWALGCVLYEMLSGQRPFKGEYDQALAYEICNMQPKALTALRSGMPIEVDRIVGKLLSKEPGDRYQHTDELVVDFRSFHKQHESGAGQKYTSTPDELPAQSERPGPPAAKPRATVRLWGYTGILLVAAVAAIGFWNLNRPQRTPGAPVGAPVVVLMDTPAPTGVYDPQTRRNSGTNADDLNNILRDLPILIHKETLSTTWDREDQILRQRPALLAIHLSAFDHSMKAEFDFGAARAVGSNSDEDPMSPRHQLERLRDVSLNKLVALLGYVGLGDPKTKFLVYSRGPNNAGWTDSMREEWVREVEGRFPHLEGRVFTLNVPGRDEATFRETETARVVRARVVEMLGLPGEGQVAAQ